MKKTNLAVKYPVLGSSVDATKISMTIKGILGLVVTVLVGLGVSQVDLEGLTNDITNAVEISVQLFFLIVAIWGGARKLWVKYKK